ncbi:MAG: flagellar protein FliT [Deltaproteobacteria bacterium]|nr:flagellar protein FliT [Deltaproteobacteria bacterium]
MNPNSETNTLAKKKLALLRHMLELTQKQMLLADLDGLSPLLDEKDRLIDQMRQVDSRLPQPLPGPKQQPPNPVEQEMIRLIEAILENEKRMEARMEEEKKKLSQEILSAGRQNLVKQYLDSPKTQGGSVNLKK